MWQPTTSISAISASSPAMPLQIVHQGIHTAQAVLTCTTTMSIQMLGVPAFHMSQSATRNITIGLPQGPQFWSQGFFPPTFGAPMHPPILPAFHGHLQPIGAPPPQGRPMLALPAPPIRRNISFDEFMDLVDTECNGNATSDIAIERCILESIGEERGSWIKYGRFTREEYREIAFKVYQKTGEVVSGLQVKDVFEKAKIDLRQKLQACISKGLDSTATERKLATWPLYPSFKYYRGALAKIEVRKRLIAAKAAARNGKGSGRSSNLPSMSSTAHQGGSNMETSLLTEHLNEVFHDNLSQQGILRSAVTKVLVAIDDRKEDFGSPKELFQFIAN